MIRINRVTEKERVAFEIRIDGKVVFFTFSEADAAVKLKELGVHDPAPFIAGCRQWGAVEIHVDRNADWRGG